MQALEPRAGDFTQFCKVSQGNPYAKKFTFIIPWEYIYYYFVQQAFIQ